MAQRHHRAVVAARIHDQAGGEALLVYHEGVVTRHRKLRGEAAQVKTQLVRTDPLIAPLSQGQQVGTLKVLSGTRVLAEVPVTVLEPVAQAGMFGRAWDQLRLWLR